MLRSFYQLLLTALMILFSLATNAQESNTRLVAGSTFIMNTAGWNAELPFWHHANQNGIVDNARGNALIYLSGTHELLSTQRFNILTGGTFFSRLNTDIPAVNQLYAHLRGYGLILSAGKFIDPITTTRSSLSTGSFMISANASPIPKIALYTDGFQSVPGTAGIVRYKGLFAHGFFEEDRYARRALLHQKYFYLSINYSIVEASGGIIHNVQWAGTDPLGTAFPRGWRTFLNVVTGMNSNDPNASAIEQTNSVGNSLAAYDFGLAFKPEGFTFRIDRSFYLEDKVSMRFRNIWDGLWSVRLIPANSRLVQEVVYEHINTKRGDSFPYEPRGTANFYNHSVYRSGWTFLGRTIGNPLLVSDGSIDQPIISNILAGHHAGLRGRISDRFGYRLLYTYTRNYGVWRDQEIERLPLEACNGREGTICTVLRPLSELREDNHSIYAELSRTTDMESKFTYRLSISSDLGEFYPDRLGIGATVEYRIR